MENALDDGLAVLESREDVLGATVAFDQAKLERAAVAFLVYVRDCAHDWAHDDFCMIVEEVYLKLIERTLDKLTLVRILTKITTYLHSSVGQVENNGVSRSQPGSQERQSRHLVSRTWCQRSARLF